MRASYLDVAFRGSYVFKMVLGVAVELLAIGFHSHKAMACGLPSKYDWVWTLLISICRGGAPVQCLLGMVFLSRSDVGIGNGDSVGSSASYYY